jgi:hypothetical protein
MFRPFLDEKAAIAKKLRRTVLGAGWKLMARRPAATIKWRA